MEPFVRADMECGALWHINCFLLPAGFSCLPADEKLAEAQQKVQKDLPI